MKLPNEYQSYIHLSRYARYIDDEKRRETWPETVARYINYFKERDTESKISTGHWRALQQAILNHEIMPSMRALMTAGPALDRDNVAGYNCAYVAVDNPRVFDETMYVLMCGTGVGFSVERQYVNKLPEIAEEFHETDTNITVRDSKVGWAAGFRQLVSLLYAGQIPRWDLSRLRPAGARLKTFGGRASGPEPLEDLFRYCVESFRNAAGRKLNSIECHDLMCKVADVVVCGGVRRSALLSLSNLTDDRMRNAKSGEWFNIAMHRALANNSVCYTEKPDMGAFLKEWRSLYESKSGERGIFNRCSAQKIAARNGRRDADMDFGTNPCSEIILRNKQFCNLTEVVVRSNDTKATVAEKVKLATILGTLQSTLTDFRYLSKKWRDNTEDERLLGVSFTGIFDNLDIFTDTNMGAWKDVAVETNKKFATRLGISTSAAITCVKPSGTVSQLVNSASGMHPRFAKHYIRRVRQDKKDPLAQWMIDKGFPYEEDFYSPSNVVFQFPIASPKNAVVVDDVSAIKQLEFWKRLQENWCEHKPSITVYVKEDEWLEVGAWVYRNFDLMSGVSFLPQTEHSYRQAPYTTCTADEYKKALGAMPRDVDWTTFKEETDTTTSSQELACVGNSCEL